MPMEAGAAMEPIHSLKKEHAIILGVLEAAEHEVQEMRRRGAYDAAMIGGMLDFFRNFVHRCHQIKEERFLFVRLQRRISPGEGVSLVPLLRCHDDGRRQLNLIANMLLPAIQEDYWTVMTLADYVATYLELLRAHIEREEELLFPLAESHLTAEDAEELEHQFHDFILHEFGPDEYRRHRRLARELTQQLPSEQVGMTTDWSSVHLG
jgi:hemerythrin-like domain-containing protein